MRAKLRARIKGLTALLMCFLFFAASSVPTMAANTTVTDLHTGDILYGGDRIGYPQSVVHEGQTFLISGTFYVYLNNGSQIEPNRVDTSVNPNVMYYELPAGVWKVDSNTISVTHVYNNGHYYVVLGRNGGSIKLVTSTDVPAVATPTSSGTLCNHDYQWELEIEPTETTDGEELLKCTKCGNVIQRQTVSAYPTYIKSCMTKITDANDGDTVTIKSNTWNSYPKSFFEAVAAKNITVKIQFPDSKHIMQELTITSEQAKAITDDYTGPEKMKALGATESVK